MTQEEKFLLLQDLCARLPYGVKIYYGNKTYSLSIPYLEDVKNIALGHEYSRGYNIKNISIKPYLRPMSSMNEEEKQEYIDLLTITDTSVQDIYINVFNWYHIHHFDYRGLIERGLALEAPEGMYEKE